MQAESKKRFLPIVPPDGLRLGQAMGGAFKMFKRAPGPMIGGALFLAAVSVIPEFWMAATPDFPEPSEGRAGLDQWFSQALVPLLVVTIVVVFLSLPVGGAIAYATGRACLGQTTSFAGSLVKALRRLPALLVVGLIGVALGLGPLGLTIYSLVKPLVEYYDHQGQSGYYSIESGVLALGFVLSVVLIFVAVPLSLADSAIMLEEAGPFKALARSWRLTAGGYAQLLGRLIAVGFWVGLANVAANIVAGWIPLLGSPVAAIGSWMAFSWQAAAVTLFYVDRRIRKEDLGRTIWQAAIEVLPPPIQGADHTDQPADGVPPPPEPRAPRWPED
ncbi:MAG: hypothetical protein FWG16_04565 [Micrococcales bacterium]|nr:hypothetical protein [Micrococcales bacterium]